MTAFQILERLRVLGAEPGPSARRLYLRAERELFKRPEVLCGPAIVKLNTGYRCNLHCPLCPTGRRDRVNSGDLTLRDAEFIDGRLGKAHRIHLFGWGEPFLNKEIFGIIEFLKHQGHYVGIDSNLSIENENTVDGIANSGIDFLSVSLGRSRPRFVLGVSIRRLLRHCVQNMRRLAQAPNGPKRIQWQYLVSRKSARSSPGLARSLGKLASPLSSRTSGCT